MFADELLQAVLEPIGPARPGFDVDSIRRAYAETKIKPTFDHALAIDKAKMWPEYSIQSSLPHVALAAQKSGMMIACVVSMGIPANADRRIAKLLDCPESYIQGFKTGWTDQFDSVVLNHVVVDSDLVQGWCDGEAARLAIMSDMN